MKDSFPPLLRGIGMLFVLAAAIIAFCIARGHDLPRPTATAAWNPVEMTNGNSVATLVNDVRELQVEVQQDDVVEEVLENAWFELIGLFGTALLTASFFAEAYVRRSKKAS